MKRVLTTIFLSFVLYSLGAQTLILRFRVLERNVDTVRIAGVYNGLKENIVVGDSLLTRYYNSCVTGVVTEVESIDYATRSYTIKVKTPMPLQSGEGILYNGKMVNVPPNVPTVLTGCALWKVMEFNNSTGGGGGGSGASIDSSFLANDSVFVAEAGSIFFTGSKRTRDYVVVTGLNGVYQDGGYDFKADGFDDQVEIQQAFDFAASTGKKGVLLDGIFYVSDSVAIKANYNIEIFGLSPKMSRIVANGFAAGVPVFSYDLQGDTLDRIVWKNFAIDASSFVNTSNYDKGVIRHAINGRVEYVEYDGLEIVGNGNYNTCISHSFSHPDSIISVGTIILRNSFLKMIGTGKVGQYCFRVKNQADKVIVEDNRLIIEGTPSGTPGIVNFNALAIYGQALDIYVSGNTIICQTEGHSPLSVSPGKRARIIGNYVYMREGNTAEGLIEVERKNHASTWAYDTVGWSTIVGNVLEFDSTATQNWWGVVLTVRDPAGGQDSIEVRYVTVAGNVIRNCQIGILADRAFHVVPSGNVYDNVETHIDYGRTDLEVHPLGASEFHTLLVDGDTSSISMYDHNFRGYREIARILAGDKVLIGNKVSIDRSANNVAFGDNTDPYPVYFYGKVNQVDNTDYDTYFGNEAGQYESGRFNSFFGYRGGRFSSGNYNVGVGYNVMANSSSFSGSDNVSVGYNSLTNVTTGSSNVLVGSRAGASLTTGNSNIGIGKSALVNLTTGSSNVAIGGGTALSQGFYNVAIGNSSLSSSPDGNGNVAIGASALQGDVTKYYNSQENVCVGYYSGIKLAGQNNVMVGGRTGPQGVLDTLSGVVYIGYSVGQSNTIDNRLMIDNSNTNTPLIDGQFDTDQLTINGTLIVTTTQGGVQFPQLTTAQRDAIASPAAGLTIFCTDCTANDTSTGVLQTYNGSTWKNHW